jgi:hypothetical protein
MRKKRFSVEQMIGVLKQTEVGVPGAEVIRKAGISTCRSERCIRPGGGFRSPMAFSNAAIASPAPNALSSSLDDRK